MSTAAEFSSDTNSPTNKRSVNVGSYERWASAIGGGALTAYGLTRRSRSGLLLSVLGAGMLYRGTTGHCNVYEALGVDTATNQEGENRLASVARDVHVEQSVTINKSPAEIYSFWREFGNLPRFMKHLESVTTLASGISRWVAKGPTGEPVEWDAEIFNEKENELISWRSLPGSEFVNAGTVRFEPASGDRGTIVRVTMNYNVTGGRVTAALARLLGQAPEQLVAEDLRRLKQILETGEIATIEGQTSGRAENAHRIAERKTSDTLGERLPGRAKSKSA
ncbi:MAG: SRPBCC family protein [Pyrinomonadaceae bacterium]